MANHDRAPSAPRPPRKLGTVSVVIGSVVCIVGFLVMAWLVVLIARELLVWRDD